MHRVHLDDLAGVGLGHVASLVVLPAFGAPDVLLSQYLVDLGDGQADLMPLLQEVGDLLPAAAVFALADGPDKLLGGQAYPPRGARLLAGRLMPLKKSGEALLLDALQPQNDSLAVAPQMLGDAGFGDALPEQVPGQRDLGEFLHDSSMPTFQ